MAYNLEEVDPGEGGELYADQREEDAPRSGRLLRIIGAIPIPSRAKASPRIDIHRTEHWGPNS